MTDLTPAAAIHTAVFSSHPATPATATPSPPTIPTNAPTAAQTVARSHAGLSETEAALMIEWEKENLAKGKITPEEAAKRFDNLGATPEQRAPDTRSDEVKQLDKDFPPAKETDYNIQYYTPGQAPPVLTKELQQFDTTARAWLSRAQFDRTLGNSLITEISRIAQQTKNTNADELESYGYAEFAKLERAYGDTLDAKLEAARQMVEALDKKTPGLKNLLRSKGIGDSALVVEQILGQSERWHARKGR